MAKKPFDAGDISESNTFVDATDNTKKLTIDVGGTTGVTGVLSTAFTTAKTIAFPDTAGTVALAAQLPAAAAPGTAGLVHGFTNSTSNSRTTLGFQAGNVATGTNNTLLGYRAGVQVTTGTNNTLIGNEVGFSITTSANNVIVGGGNTNGNQNVSVGPQIGTMGSNNIVLGAQALGSNSSFSMSNSVIIGSKIGHNAGTFSGSDNVIIGREVMQSGTVSGAQNTLIGSNTLSGGTSASNNVAVGFQAGTAITTGTNNIVIGSTAAATSATVSNEITLGNASITSFRIPGLSLTADASNPIVQATSTQTLTNKVIGTTSTTSITANTATTVDTNALNSFTTAKYVISIKQGSKIRSSEVIMQTDGTSLDMTEFGITETGGTIAGVVVSASVSSTNAVLQVTITDAETTNATVKINEILI